MSDPKEILEKSKVIAVVGLSTDTSRKSHSVSKYLQNQGYKIIPVNPKYDEILGEKCYDSLKDIPDDIEVDMVDVFRRPEYTPAVAKAAVEIGAKYLWLQLGIKNEEAKNIAEDAGLGYVEDKCTHIEHNRYFG